jgi:hypothetical protein
MNNHFKEEFTYRWGHASCIVEDDEKAIANEQLKNFQQFDLFENEKEKDQK